MRVICTPPIQFAPHPEEDAPHPVLGLHPICTPGKAKCTPPKSEMHPICRILLNLFVIPKKYGYPIGYPYFLSPKRREESNPTVRRAARRLCGIKIEKAYDLLYDYCNAHAVFQSNKRKAVMVCWILKKCFKRINCLFSDS